MAPKANATAVASNTEHFDRPALGSEPVSRLLDATEPGDVVRLELDRDADVDEKIVDVEIVGRGDPARSPTDVVTLKTDATATVIRYAPKHTGAVGTPDFEPLYADYWQSAHIARAEIVEHATPVTTTNVRRLGYRRSDGLRSGTRIFRSTFTPDEQGRARRQAQLVGSLYDGQAVYDHDRGAVYDVSLFTGKHDVRYVALKPRDSTSAEDVSEIPVHQFAYSYIAEGALSFLRPRLDGSAVVSSYPARPPSEICRSCECTHFVHDAEHTTTGSAGGLIVKSCRYCGSYGAKVQSADGSTLYTTGALEISHADHSSEVDEAVLRRALETFPAID